MTTPDLLRCKSCGRVSRVKARPVVSVLYCDYCWARYAYEHDLCKHCGGKQR